MSDRGPGGVLMHAVHLADLDIDEAGVGERAPGRTDATGGDEHVCCRADPRSSTVSPSCTSATAADALAALDHVSQTDRPDAALE